MIFWENIKLIPNHNSNSEFRIETSYLCDFRLLFFKADYFQTSFFHMEVLHVHFQKFWKIPKHIKKKITSPIIMTLINNPAHTWISPFWCFLYTHTYMQIHFSHTIYIHTYPNIILHSWPLNNIGVRGANPITAEKPFWPSLYSSPYLSSIPSP